MSSQKLKQASTAVRRLIKDGEVAGAITLVARHGKVVFFEAQGARDVATGKPMTRDTILRFYSMTKPVTTVAAMILWEKGRIKLDDPVSKYLPEFKGLKVYAGGKGDDLKLVAPRREMTVRDLMRHTSGLIYGGSKTPVDQLIRKARIFAPGSTLPDMVKKLGKLPLVYQPGTRFEYGVSTDVLGRLVEVVSKKKLDEFFREHIFQPLDMRDTGFFVPEKDRARFAATHGRKEKAKLIVTEAPDKSRYLKKPTLLSGGGGLVSTARDYARFCQMLLGKGQLDGRRILRADTVALMTKNQLPDKAMPLTLGNRREGVGFGLGFSVRVAAVKGDAGRVAEYGWGGAASTHFWISPKDDLFVLALQQYMPYTGTLEAKLKPIIYGALEDAKH
jgi:CubicO group peptidase (beta-lactamase class C family)